jgi:hypothetical protein
MMIPKSVKLTLKLASDIVPKLPARGDTLLQVAVKALSIVDSIEGIYAPAKRNALEQLIERLGLEETRNEQFVSLFFGTNLYEQFTIRRFSLTEYMDVIQASHKNMGSLFFVEYTYSNNGPEESFYHTKGIDFSEILKGLWDGYEGRLHVTIGPGQWGSGTKSEFATFSEIPNPMFGDTQADFDHLVGRHRRFAMDKVPRSYMFYGDAGTGKSSFVIAFAEKLGHRTLKLDASSLGHVHVRDITFLLTHLAPDFLMIDDVDKADPGKGLPTLLDILQRFKTDHPHVSVLMTANKTDGFDPGMLRPGRIDTWVKFGLPNTDQRRVLFTRYLDEHKVTLDPLKLEAFIEMTDGLSQDYVRGIALELKYDEVEHVSKTIAHMIELLKKAEKAEKARNEKATAPSATPAESKANGVIL